jgi:putative phosphoesterase
MRVGIISDTHDRLDRTAAAVELLQSHGAEALIHCGDLTGPEVVDLCGPLPGHFVLGNNDDDTPALRRAIAAAGGHCLGWGGVVRLAGKRLAVTHGHLAKELRALTAQEPDYLLFGHSHVAADYREDGTRYINPGALHRAAQLSVAVLDLRRDELRFLFVPR